MKSALKSFIRIFGYDISKASISKSNYSLFEYKDKNGEFDYSKYKEIQTEGNKRKLDRTWVKEENIKFLSSFLLENISNPSFGLCHGTRGGKEQKWFKKYMDIDVIGTEISDTATKFADTIEWDFHEVKPEWIASVDFIYSNSLDHSYNPEECLNSWMSCIRKGGFCILEHSSDHEKSSELDPFGASVFILPYLISKWGSDKYFLKKILEIPEADSTHDYTKFLVIQNF